MKKRKLFSLIIILLLSFTFFSCEKTNDVLPNIDDLNRIINNLNEQSYTCEEKTIITDKLDSGDITDSYTTLFTVQNNYAYILFNDEKRTFSEAFIEKINDTSYSYYKEKNVWRKGNECTLGELVTDLTEMGFEFTEDLFSYKDGKWIGNNESLSKEFEKTISTSGDVDVKVSKFEITALNNNIISAEYEYQVDIFFNEKTKYTTVLNTKLNYSNHNNTVVNIPDGLELIGDVTRLIKAVNNLQKCGFTAEEQVSIKYLRSGFESEYDYIYENQFKNNIYHSNELNIQLEETFRQDQTGMISYYFEFDDNNKTYKKTSRQDWSLEPFENTDAYFRQNAYCPFTIKNGYFKNYGDEYWYAEKELINDLFLNQVVKELKRYDIPSNKNNTSYNIETLEIRIVEDKIYSINFRYKATVTTDLYQYDVEMDHQFIVISYVLSGDLGISWPIINK